MISPVLSNVFLHYVLDEWFAEQVQPRLRGTEYAGPLLRRLCDAVCAQGRCGAGAGGAGKRLGKFGLELHPDKTRLVDFRPPAERCREIVESTLPTTFKFLGLYSMSGARSRKGKAAVWQRTAKDRLARTLKAINQQCRVMRPWPIAAQHQRLCRMLEGHFAYFGITGNYPAPGHLLSIGRGGSGGNGCRGGRGRAMSPGSGLRGCLNASVAAPRIVHRYTLIVSEAVP